MEGRSGRSASEPAAPAIKGHVIRKSYPKQFARVHSRSVSSPPSLFGSVVVGGVLVGSEAASGCVVAATVDLSAEAP